MPSSTRLIYGHQLGALGSQAVEGPAADEVLHRPLVHVRAVEHPLAEILEGGEITVLLPLAHHRLDKAPADVLDRHQAEADAPLLHGEAGHRSGSHPAAAGRCRSPCTRRYTRPPCRSYPAREVSSAAMYSRVIVALEISRLIGHHRIADGVGLVEGVVGEVVDLVDKWPGPWPRGCRWPRSPGCSGPDRRGGRPPAPAPRPWPSFWTWPGGPYPPGPGNSPPAPGRS